MSTPVSETIEECLTSLRWTSTAENIRRPSFYICIVASFIHAIFWLQFALFPMIRHKAMQWIYAYLLTDIVLLARLLFLYSVRSRSTICNPSYSWFQFVCYVDSFVDNYINVLQVYIFLALNFCRYIQIVYNRNPYVRYRNHIVAAHISIYFCPFILLLGQFFIGWSKVVIIPGDSCDVTYANIYIKCLNVLFIFAIPIGLNLILIFISVHHVRKATRNRTLQQRHQLSAREKYNRSLVIQFLCFYAIWISLWSPNVIMYQFMNGMPILITYARLLNYIEIALDPFIIVALDVRFGQPWKKIWLYLKIKSRLDRVQPGGQQRPATTERPIVTIEQLRRTGDTPVIRPN